MSLLTDTAEDQSVESGSNRGFWASRPWAGPVVAVGCVVVAALAYLGPALLHGTRLGTEDILNTFGLGAVPGSHPHNLEAGDQIDDMMPWAALSWEQVRHGQLPLWNPYAGFGLPLMFGFQSASLSLPMLVTYLFPVSFVYTIEVIVKLLIGGTGVLWLCRKLGLSYLPSVMAAVSFELSGAFTAYLGWPMSGTFAWLGWAAGAALMVVRGPRRTLYSAGLAVSLAFAVYGGHPETMVVLVLCVGVLALSALVGLVVETGRASSAIRPLVALGLSGMAAIGLSAPLLLPGLQVVSRANRSSVLGISLPTPSIVNVLFASYHGLPVASSRYFGPVEFYGAAAYVGVVVVVLAGLAVIARWRDSRVIGFVLIALVCAALTYFTAVSHVLDTIPIIKNGQWTRALGAMDFALAVLGGIGLQTLLDRGRETVIRAVFAALTGAVAVLLGVLWFGHLHSGLPSIEARIQGRSFVWPTVGVAVLSVVAVALFLPERRGKRFSARSVRLPTRLVTLGLALCGVQAVFLLTATPGIWSSSNSFFPVTPAIATLQSEVGQARVGYSTCPSIIATPGLGILPEANSAYGVREAAAYDGIVPKSYFTAYFDAVHQPVPANTGFGQYCPSMSNAVLARQFGVSYVLAAAGSAEPPGLTFVTAIAGEELYRVPGGSVVTTEPEGSPPDSAGATEVPVGGSDPSSMHLTVSDSSASVMYIHVTNFPGWKATIDGRPLSLHDWGGTMMAAAIPAGHHVVVIRYMPAAFRYGVLLAILTAVALIGSIFWSIRRSRKARVATPFSQPPRAS
jgi:Bacterial membrane protein YfhO